VGASSGGVAANTLDVAATFGTSVFNVVATDSADGNADAQRKYGLRLSILAFLGGGTNDVQRGLIARGLGLS
jgi:hypothetical protein